MLDVDWDKVNSLLERKLKWDCCWVVVNDEGGDDDVIRDIARRV